MSWAWYHIRQRFDFSASHRLHVPGLSDEENRRLFGKCNNPGGHGHNYQFEACVAVPSAPDLQPVSSSTSPRQPPAPAPFTLETLERLADEAIIRRFDHKNLTTDTDEFCPERGGVNATVENIARFFHGLLEQTLRNAAPDVRLRSVTVWETDRTSACYPA